MWDEQVGEWKTAVSPETNTPAVYTENGFNAENMRKTIAMPPVDLYDRDTGEKYKYRIVQTDLKRTDRLVEGADPQTCVYTGSVGSENYGGEGGDIQLDNGGDKYHVTVSELQGDNTVTFDYQLIGTITIYVRKVWNVEPEDHVDIELRRYNFTAGREEICPVSELIENNPGIVFNEGANTFKITENNTGYHDEPWTVSLDVPAYDDEGHEFDYSIRENPIPNDCGVAYHFDRENKLYTVFNSRGGDGISIEIKKQNNLKIHVDENVPNEDPMNDRRTVTLTESGFWETEIDVEGSYQYRADYFKEYVNDWNTDYTTIEDLRTQSSAADYGFSDQTLWLYKVLSTKNYPSGRVLDACENADILNAVKFNNLVGIYNDGHYYYAVEHVTSSDQRTINITNTRIGVVNYCVNFDWIVGDWLKIGDPKTVKVRVAGTVGGRNVITYSGDFNIDGNSNDQKYYIKNLPKYDDKGRIINYTLTEVEIDGRTVSGETCMVESDILGENETCVVTVADGDYQNGTSNHTDDMMNVTITNQFSAVTSFSIKKQWADHDGPEVRPDIYIKLNRAIDGSAKVPTQNNSTPGQIESDYSLVRNDKYNWTYTYSGLEKYNGQGYRYVYCANELAVSGDYKTEYLNDSANENDKKHWGRPSDNDKKRYAYSGGTIKNTVIGTVIINGEKLWKKIDPIFTKEYYPVAEVRLFQGDHDFVDNESDNTITLDEKYPDKVKKVSETTIYNGSNSFYFTEGIGGFAGLRKEEGTNALILPKYDDEGYAYNYILKEQAITGYVSRIENNTVINNYTGGEKINIRVDKKWEHIDPGFVYPPIQIVLHQVVRAAQSSPQSASQTSDQPQAEKLIEYASFTHLLGSGQDGYTFRDISKTAPDGKDFEFYVTENMMQNSVDKAYFNSVDDSELNAILGAFNQEQFGYICKITGVTDVDNSSEAGYSKKATITNTYEPGEQVFNGKIEINKSWDYKGYESDDYKNYKNYEVTLSRRTNKIKKYDFAVIDTAFEYSSDGSPISDTPNDDGETPDVPLSTATSDSSSTSALLRYPKIEFKNSGGFTHELKSMTAFSTGGETAQSQNEISYYEAVFNCKYTGSDRNHEITVKIYADGNRKIEIDHLPVYGQDALSFTYSIKETPIPAFTTNITKNDVALDENSRQELALKNTLKVVNIRANKNFLKKYTDDIDNNEKSASIPIDDVRQWQFFDQSYLDQLKFTLSRTSESNNSDYNNIGGAVRNGVTFDSENKIYYVQWNNLPLYDPNGKKYKYTIIEDESKAGDGVEVNSNMNGTEISDAFSGDTYYTSVNNKYPAKEITVNKYWNDFDNADGLRPSNINVVIDENVSGLSTININKTLKSGDNWTMKVQLPRYYYHSSERIEQLSYGISENMSGDEVLDENGDVSAAKYNLTNSGYKSEYKRGYKLDDKQTQDLPQRQKVEINGSNSLSELFVENERESRVSALLHIEKNWDTDLDENWGTRPDSLYVKVMRNNGGTEEAARRLDNNIEGDEIGVIELKRTSNYSTDIDSLPIGTTAGADTQDDGTHTRYKYFVWECDSAGNVYDNDADTDFGYTWEQKIGASSSRSQNTADESEFIIPNLANEQLPDPPKLYSTVTNTPKTTKHRFTKVWKDETNAYDSRGTGFVVHLYRKRADEAEYTDLTNETGIRPTVRNTLSVQSADPGTDTHIHTFEDLPLYDTDGEKFEYTVREISIGGHNVEECTPPDPNRQKTRNYWVTTESGSSQTTITNELINPDDFIHVEAKKIWNDNNNQDGVRPNSITVKLKRTLRPEGGASSQDGSVQYNEEILSPDNNWYCIWKNCPKYSPDGREYEYSVEEVRSGALESEYSLISTNININLKPAGAKESDPEEKTENYTFTNEHTPKLSSLTVNKTWNDTNNSFGLRPKKIRFTLYAKYESYTDTDTNVSTRGENPTHDTDHDGKADTADIKTAQGVTAVFETDTDVGITNELRTHDVTVYKKWNDSGFTDTDLHYDIDITVSDNDINYHSTKTIFKSGNSGTGTPEPEGAPQPPAETNESKTDSGNTLYGVKFTNVPMYKDGVPVDLTNYISEKVSGSPEEKKYGYEGSKAVTEYDTEYSDVPSEYTITNTLPVTDLTIDKTWSDYNNKYGLRPENGTFDLRRTVTPDNSGSYADFKNYTLTSQNKKGSNANEWTFTTEKLLKYDENNSPFTYKLTERNVNAYDPAPDEFTALSTSNDTTAEFTNTLKVKTVTVTKHWNDNGYNGTDYKHSDLTITLKPSDITLTGGAITGTIVTPSNANAASVTIINVPIEDKNGSSIQYDVEERFDNNDDREYGYIKIPSDKFVPASGGETPSYTITNTLPLTSITINKKWSDDSDKYGLRPERVTFKIYRKTSSDTSWGTAVASAAINDTSTVNNSITIEKLLRYDENNNEYTYKIAEERSGLGAYESVNDETAVPASGDAVANNILSRSVSFENKLAVTDLTVRKKWVDQYNGNKTTISKGADKDYEHYDVKVNISAGNLDLFNSERTDLTKTIRYSNDGEDENGVWSNTETVTFENVPLYLSDGTKVKYSISETTEDPAKDKKYGYIPAYGYITGNTVTPLTNQTFTPSDNQTALHITNTLPTVDVKVTKQWSDLNDKYRLRPDSVPLQLYRTTKTGELNDIPFADGSQTEADGWKAVGNANSAKTASGNSWEYTFSDLLRFDEDNNEYRFTVKEVGEGSGALKGYTPTYSLITNQYNRLPKICRLKIHSKRAVLR